MKINNALIKKGGEMFIYMQKKGQSTLEYALMVGVVVAALIYMQTYMKRAVQGRLKSSSDEIGEQFSANESTYKYTTTTKTLSRETSQLASSESGKNAVTSTISNTTQFVDRRGTEVVSTYDKEGWLLN